MKALHLSLFCFIFIFVRPTFGQDTIQLTLLDAIEIGLNESNSSKRIRHEYNSSNWRYKMYRARVLPKVELSGTVPDFNRSISPQLLPDGTQNFIEYNNWNTSLGLRVSQPITPTGGQVFINSNIQRIINVEVEENGTSYFTTPISIGFSQSLTGFNEYRWLKMTEPLKLEEASRDRVERREFLSMQVVQSFFNLLVSQEQLDIAIKNHENNMELYKISKGRYNLGRIAENELLQMELSVLQASNSVETSKISLQRNRNEFFSLLNLPSIVQVKLIVPAEIKSILVDPEHAVDQANSNRKDVIGFQRRLIEAERDLAQAKSNRRPQANLVGSFGLNQSAYILDQAYKNPLDQERFNLGIQIPIYNAGSAQSAYKIAQSERDITNIEVEEAKRGFERDVRLKASEIQLLDLQIQIAAKTDTIAQKRYMISKYRYEQGKIAITDLNLAQAAKDEARVSYIFALLEYWSSYYELRQLTLFDYLKNEKLIRDGE